MTKLAETWTLTVSNLKLKVAQLWRGLGDSVRYKIRNEIIRHRTKVLDITQKVSKLKWQSAGHVCR